MPSEIPMCQKHGVRKRRRSDGKGFRCGECKNEAGRLRYERNREEILAKNKAYYQANKEDAKRRSRSAHLRKNYGITLEEFEELLEQQNGKCAICKKKPINEKHQFGVDHDHKNGKIRGLLCKRCNLVLGNALDDPRILREAARYLELAPSILDAETEAIISRWSEQEFYVYMRPISKTLMDRRAKHTVYWVVTVEYRTMPPGRWQAEGESLAEVIRELDQTVPRRRGGHRIDQRRQPGLNAPRKAQKRAQRLAHEDKAKPKKRKRVTK